MTSDLFSAVRSAVSALDAAEQYGVEVRRGWCRCPFHAGGGERTASLRFYLDGGWHCFGCGAGGSSIDFTMQLFGLSPLEAAKKLNADFGLGLDVSAPVNRETVRQRQRVAAAFDGFNEWRESLIRDLAACCLEAHRGLQAVDETGTLDVLTPAQVTAIQWREALEDWSDVLLSGGLDEQMKIFRYRKEVKSICDRTLRNTRQKLKAG